MKRPILLVMLFFVVFIGFSSHKVHAEGNSITISPVQVDIEVSTTDTEKRSSFTISNSYNVPVELSIELKGIDAAAGLIIPTETIDEGLASTVRLSATQIIIPEQTTSTVTLVITNSNLLSPGGHYGTVVFTQRKVGDRDVNFTQAISAGLFVVKRGGQLREVDASKIIYHNVLFQIPTSAQLTLKNIGNVHVIPRGSVLVYDHSGELIAKGIVDAESKRVLPGRELKDRVTIHQTRRLWLPQELKLVFEYRADGIEEAKFVEKHVLYIPAYVVPLALFIVLVFILIVRKKLKKRRPRVKLSTFGELVEETVVAVAPLEEPQQTETSTKSIKKTSKKRTKKPKNISVNVLEA
jgi:hypothetical protein